MKVPEAWIPNNRRPVPREATHRNSEDKKAHITAVENQPLTEEQLPPCGHPAIMDTPIIRTTAKSPAKTNYRRLTEINSRYYGLSLLRTLTQGPYSVRNKGS